MKQTRIRFTNLIPHTVHPESAQFEQNIAEVADWSKTPPQTLENLTRLKVVLDGLTQEMSVTTPAIRRWTKLQRHYRVSPCLLPGELTNHGVPAACEVDIANAVVMYALGAASGIRLALPRATTLPR